MTTTRTTAKDVGYATRVTDINAMKAVLDRIQVRPAAGGGTEFVTAAGYGIGWDKIHSLLIGIDGSIYAAPSVFPLDDYVVTKLQPITGAVML